MSKQRNLIWEKWSDPFSTMQFEAHEPLDHHEEISVYEDQESYEQETKSMQHIKGIITPMGIVPYNENTSADNIFNFWVGHTNFDISQNVANKIENTPGVEILDIFTRYRFRIGIGKAFKDRIVMHNIQRVICNEKK